MEALENISLAELRAVYAKDAIRLVNRVRVELPRPGKDYGVVRCLSNLFDAKDWGGGGAAGTA